MFCTFTTTHGTLIIRTEDIRRLADTVRYDHAQKIDVPVCVVEWAPNGTELFSHEVQGTARENLDRLRDEEIRAIEAAQRLQQRQQQGLPAVPFSRGGKVRRA